MDATRLPLLAVDLDGTLLRSNMLHESFWSAFSQSWATPLVALARLGGGRARLKAHLGAASAVDPALLPYNDAVLDYVRDWRARGGRTALVTATDQPLAEAIAAHLGLFDEVIGSDGATNVKGEAKAARLVERHGVGGYAYIGDSHADRPVWRDAAKVIVHNPDAGLRRALERSHASVEVIAGTRPGIAAYARQLRVHHWAKNPLIFLPMLGAHRADLPTLLPTLLAFIAFCLTASSVYVLNDLLDLSADRKHDRKRTRPFASGEIPIEQGWWICLLLWTGALATATVVGPYFVAILLAYFALTTSYSLYLKRKPVVDICALATLYTIRIGAGAIASDVPLSVWMLAFSLFLFFSLAAIKRQAELVDGLGSGRDWLAGRGYNVADQAIISQMAIASGYLSVLVLALYINSPDVERLYAYPPALWGICLILLYWISRMAMVAGRGQMHDDPIVFAATDRVSWYCLVMAAVFVIVGAML